MSDERPEREPITEHQRESIPAWFVVLTAVVLLWVAYYIYEYWGGLGPGVGY